MVWQQLITAKHRYDLCNVLFWRREGSSWNKLDLFVFQLHIYSVVGGRTFLWRTAGQGREGEVHDVTAYDGRLEETWTRLLYSGEVK